jgi:hypothetical protein
MIPDEFKRYIQSTYRQDVFGYKQKALEKICTWGDKWQPDSIKLLKNILLRIKAGEGKPDKNPLKNTGKYVSCPAIGKKYMTLFFELSQPPDTHKFVIYDFKIGDYNISNSA